MMMIGDARQALVRVRVVAHQPFVDDPIAGTQGQAPSTAARGSRRQILSSRWAHSARPGPPKTLGTILRSDKNAQQLLSTQ
jgi:hypothetical protein